MTSPAPRVCRRVIFWSIPLTVLAGIDLVFAPHTPLHWWPQPGIYLTLPGCGIGICLLLAVCIRTLLTLGKDYYDER